MGLVSAGEWLMTKGTPKSLSFISDMEIGLGLSLLRGGSLHRVLLGGPRGAGEPETVSFGNCIDSVLEFIHPCHHLQMGELLTEHCPSIISWNLSMS